MKTYSPDFLIVGGGVAGCATAVQLQKKGYDVLVVERMTKPRRVYKAEYIQAGPCAYLKEIGFGSIFEGPWSTPIKSLRFQDLNDSGDVNSEITMNFPEGSASRSQEHHKLMEGVLRVAADNLGEKLWLGVEIKPENQKSKSFHDKPVFSVERDGVAFARLQPKWVIGADGRHSTVRRWMGGDAALQNGPVVLGAGRELLFGAQVEKPNRAPTRYEVVRTKRNGTVSVFSLGDAGQRIYLSSPAVTGAEIAKMGGRIAAVLKEAEPHIGRVDYDPKTQVAGAPAMTQWFDVTGVGHFILVGDAVALTTPYGGQGLTAAMAHVKYLTEEFDFNCRSKAKLAEERARYHKSAHLTHERIALLNFGIYYTFFAQPGVFKISTKHILSTWERDPELKARVVRLFGGIDMDMPTIFEILDLERMPFSKTALKWAPKLVRGRLSWA